MARQFQVGDYVHIPDWPSLGRGCVTQVEADYLRVYWEGSKEYGWASRDELRPWSAGFALVEDEDCECPAAQLFATGHSPECKGYTPYEVPR